MTDSDVQSEAAVERERKSLDELTQEEKDTLVSELMREPQTSVAVVSAVRKIDDIEAGPGELPESFDVGCQKCNEPIEEGDEYTTAFGYYYCKPCNQKAQEALKTADDTGGEA